MDHCAAPQKYKEILLHVRFNVRDRRPASAAKGARSRTCGWLALDASILMKNYHTMRGTRIGISIEITRRSIRVVIPPFIYISRRLISDKLVTHPFEGTSNHLKATSGKRDPEEELQKSREELRGIHDNHSSTAISADMDKSIDENFNPQQGLSATRVTASRDSD